MNKLTCSRMADFYWRIQFYLLLQLVIPTFEVIHAAQRLIYVNTSKSCLFRTDISRRSAVFRPCCFDSGFRVSVLLLKPRSSHSFAVNSLRFRIIFAKIQQVLTSFVTSFALCCVSCVVVEFHSSHSFTISPRIVVFVLFFVLLAVLLSSCTPATVLAFLPAG